MSREEWRSIVNGSNVPLDKNVQKKLGLAADRISFLDLVEFAVPGAKPEVWLADHTGRDPKTCKRWLDEDHGPPMAALVVVLGEIMRRIR